MTSYTVTALNTDGSNGIALQVEVVTSASETGGASAQISNGAAGTVTLTPAFSSSLIIWAIDNADSGVASVTPAANNKLLTVAANADSFEDTVNGVTYAAGYYSGTVTAGTGVTIGYSNATAGFAELAAYEIRPSPAWAEDASTPAYATATGTDTVTSASFSPPPGAVLIAVCSCNYVSNETGNKFTVSSSPALTWTLRADNTGTGNDGGASVFTATIPYPPLVISPPSLPVAVPGQAYSETLTATGGSGTGYTWSISSGSLPGWASLSTGVISGTPAVTDIGFTAFTVKVTDSASNTATEAVTLAVEPEFTLESAVPGIPAPSLFAPGLLISAGTGPAGYHLTAAGVTAAVPAVPRGTARGIAGLAATAGIALRGISRTVTADAAVTALLIRMKTALLAAQAAVTASAARQAGKLLPSPAAVTASPVLGAGKNITAVLAGIPAAVRGISGNLAAAAAVTAAVSLLKVKLLLLAVQAAVTAMMTRSANTVQSGTAAAAGTVSRALGKDAAASLGVTAAIIRSTARSISAILAAAAVTSFLKVKLVSLAAAAAIAGTVNFNLGRMVRGTAALPPRVTLMTARGVAAVTAVAAAAVRQVPRIFTAAAAAIASAVANTGARALILLAQAAAESSTGRAVASSMSAVTAATAGTAREVTRAIQAAAAAAAAALRNTARMLTAVSAPVPAVSFRKVKLVLLDAVIAVFTGVQRQVGSSQAAGAAVNAPLIRGVARGIAGNAAVNASLAAGRAFFIALASVIAVSASAAARFTASSLVTVFRLGLPAFRWMTGNARRNWRIP